MKKLISCRGLKLLEMPATVGVYQATGGTDGSPGSENEITTSTRLQTKDQFAPTDTGYPIPIPTSGFKYSYWVHIYLKILTAPSVKINNIRFYSDGSINWNYGTGGELRRGNRDTGDHGCPMDTNYNVATGVEGDSGDPIEDATNGHSYYNTQTTKTANVANDTESAPAIIDSTDHTTTGKCKAVVLQVKVASDATQGEQPDETLTFKYDEI
jgi:hypothetical protein